VSRVNTRSDGACFAARSISSTSSTAKLDAMTAPEPKRDSAQASASTAVAEASRTPSRFISSGRSTRSSAPPRAGGSTAKTWARLLAPCATRAPKRVAGETSAKPDGRAVTELEAVEVSSPLRSRAHPGRKAGATTTSASAGSKHDGSWVTSRRSSCQDIHLDGRASLRYQARDGRPPRLPALLLSRSPEGPGPRTRLGEAPTTPESHSSPG